MLQRRQVKHPYLPFFRERLRKAEILPLRPQIIEPASYKPQVSNHLLRICHSHVAPFGRKEILSVSYHKVSGRLITVALL